MSQRPALNNPSVERAVADWGWTNINYLACLKLLNKPAFNKADDTGNVKYNHLAARIVRNSMTSLPV